MLSTLGSVLACVRVPRQGLTPTVWSPLVVALPSAVGVCRHTNASVSTTVRHLTFAQVHHLRAAQTGARKTHKKYPFGRSCLGNSVQGPSTIGKTAYWSSQLKNTAQHLARGRRRRRRRVATHHLAVADGVGRQHRQAAGYCAAHRRVARLQHPACRHE